MSINENSCHGNKTKSLELDLYRMKMDILSNTIMLLNEQIESNRNKMNKLVNRLKRLGISTTYCNDNSDQIEFIYNHNLEQSVIEKAHTIQEEYYACYNKNESIKQNILELKSNFATQCSIKKLQDMMCEIEQDGITILKAQETERNRIAADLHDSIIQNLANLIHKSELCIHQIDKDPISVKLDLQLIMQNVKTIIDDIRSIIYNLRPMALEDLGIEVVIQRFLDQFEHINKVGIVFNNHCKDVKILNPVTSLTLFRIIQEVCSNAVKHGHASMIEIELFDGDNSTELLIKDNGKGFNISNQCNKVKTNNSGFGLTIMKERVYLLSGSISINSREGFGTTIHIKVPISKR